MAYLTYNNLSRQTFYKAENFGTRTYNQTMVFLSYRREDRDWVLGVVAFLKRLNVSIYVDYLDETLEDRPSEYVAGILRSRIGKCTKFLSLATPNSNKSKWMPWELGLGDRIVNYLNVGILPLTNDPNSWGDQEYGKIYGQISSKYSYNISDSNDWYITYPDGTTKKVKDWLTN